jgi:hypothetical protein
MRADPPPWFRKSGSAPHHPETNGKLERFHETLKARLNLLVYTSPEILRAAMADFIRFYNHERYQEGIGHLTPADVYHGWRDAILRRWAAQQRRTQARRIRYNRAAARQGTRTEPPGDLSVPCSLPESQRC